MEKPLHVQVAEALGWQHDGALMSMTGTRPGGSYPQRIPRYDTDWAATGPLIERYDLALEPTSIAIRSALPDSEPWTATAGLRNTRNGQEWARGATPLLAACNLILSLAAAGKLMPLLEASK
jgi:hypothetical protein